MNAAGGQPRVSVILPVYNGERYLAQAIESVLDQTFRDFELIVIDDGSTDRSPDLIRRYAQQDPRLHAYRQVNRGLVHSLNRALDLAAGKYIARMDADDVCLPERFARQAAFLDAHPETGVLGTAFQVIGPQGQPGAVVWHPESHAVLRWRLCFHSPFGHSTVMMRSEPVRQVGGYNPEMTSAEDYELWNRLQTHTRFANLPDVCQLYRNHPGSASSQTYARLKETTLKLAKANTEAVLGQEVSVGTLEAIREGTFSSRKAACEAAGLLYRLWRIFDRSAWITAHERMPLREDTARYLLILLRARKDAACAAQKLAVLSAGAPFLPLRMAARWLAYRSSLSRHQE